MIDVIVSVLILSPLVWWSSPWGNMRKENRAIRINREDRKANEKLAEIDPVLALEMGWEPPPPEPPRNRTEPGPLATGTITTNQIDAGAIFSRHSAAQAAALQQQLMAQQRQAQAIGGLGVGLGSLLGGGAAFPPANPAEGTRPFDWDINLHW